MDKIFKFKLEKKELPPLCGTCDNIVVDHSRHSCPYQCEINDDYDDDYCNCCESCTHNCMMEI